MSESKGALERLETCEKQLIETKQLLARDGQSFQFVAQKLMHLEQSLAGVAKTLAAVVTEMTDKKLISDEAIMGHIRKIDDDQEQHRISQLKQDKIIVEGEAVQPSSLVVMQASMLTADGKSTTFSEYRTLEMPGTNPSDKLYLGLIGKKAGEQVILPGQNEGDNLIFLVKEVYELASRGGNQGQQPAAQQPSSQPATQVSSTPEQAEDTPKS